MSIKRILLDSNAYLRLANSFHPLLNEPFGKDRYALYLIPEFQKEFDKSPRLANKFGWVNQLYQASRQQPMVLLSFFNLLFQIVAADGKFHPAEETAMKRIKVIFMISDQQFESIKAVYFNETDKYYKILDCTQESSNQEIKSSYKKLVKDFHPDTIVSKGLPEEFTEFATKRFREIQEAYEKIKPERDL